MKKLVSLVLALAMLLSVAAFAEGLTIENGKTVIAAYLPMTGNHMQYGEYISNGMKLAVKHWNERTGGINGTPVTLEIFDDRSDATECINIANQIVENKDKYIFASGSFASGVCMPAAPVYEDAHLLMFCPCGSHQDFCNLGEYIFAIAMTAKYEQSLYFKFVFEELKAKNVGVIMAADAFYDLQVALANWYAERTGANVSIVDFVACSTKDFTPLISSVFDGNDLDTVVVMSDYATTATIIQQIDNLGLKDGINVVTTGQTALPEFIEILGETGEGVISLTSAPPYYDSYLESMEITPTLRRFIDEYDAEYNQRANAFAGQGYDTMMVVLNCVEKYQTTDSDVLREHVGELVGMEEPVGGPTLEYDAELNQMIKAMCCTQIEDGQFVAYNTGYFTLTEEERATVTEFAGY
ncbi:MAG: ABC transporter substrate-binding protein [Clostridia bacterium]|nr:ABC transporter substrate-binding protein [Clostridia bacterium]